MRAQRSLVMRLGTERGVALVTTMLLMMLMAALMIGFSSVVVSDQNYRYIDRDRSRAFYGAQSGVEKLNAELANLFLTNVAPTDAQIAALGDTPPTIPNVTFVSAGSGTAYDVTPTGPAASGIVSTGPYHGLTALKRVYTIDATARTSGSGEVHLRRSVETVAIPVFQFGMFSEVDLSFSAADDFNFGGRVHTNGNLFLAQGGGSTSTLWLSDKVTAFGEVIRKQLSNTVPISATGSTRTVKVTTAPGAFRNLLDSEGSRIDGPTSGANGSWPTISMSTYNGNIRNGLTGVRRLNLPLITTGGTNADIVKRPAVNEDTSNPLLFGQRMFSMVSLRILLSDTANDITSLPDVTAAAPVQLDGSWTAAPPAGYGPIAAARPPIARSPGPVPNVPAGSGTITPAVAAGNPVNVVTNAMPSYFRLPATLTVTENGGATFVVACTGKTGTTFIGCTPTKPAAAAMPATVSAVVATVDGPVNVSVPVLSWPANSQTITVNGDTLDFAPNTFWIRDPAAANVGTNNLITCTGYDTATRFTGCNVPTAILNNSVIITAARSNAGIGTIGGFIKVEVHDGIGSWRDVTTEILNWGISGPNLSGKACGDPTPNAILRLQRLRDNGETGAGACSYTGSVTSSDHWPNVLFDARESVYRDAAPAAAPLLRLGGVMHYVAVDARNLSSWFAGTGVYAGGSGPTAVTDNGGFSVYFSDRRNNRNAGSLETGEYGFEDVVNPASGIGTPNGTLQTGEDMNGNNALETYGQFPAYNGVANSVPPGATAPLDVNARPTTDVGGSDARVNRAILFRRALKLTNGALGNLVTPGLTIVAENPAYVQGDWNANAGGFLEPNVATSLIADSVTLLSNNWNDNNSFSSPYAVGGRARSADTWYRLAIVAGKGPIFPSPTGSGTLGTDGGAHSFLRFLEGTGAGNDTIHYRGSLVTFYYHRQAVSPFKCCGGVVYAVPARDFSFDADFLNPATLPPLTPVFRDLNALGFLQETRPGR